MNTALRLQELLGLHRPPVAVTFQAKAPAGVPRIDSAGPSSCSYWKLAAEGRIFYTESSDHFNCPIGAYTHRVDLPTENQAELQSLLGTMLELGYLREAEIPNIPRRTESFGVAIYSPWASAPCDPDVVMIRCDAKQLMLLAEAAAGAGIGDANGLMGRPTCAMIPATIQQSRASFSLGCIGNRVYTELADGELYAAFPGSSMERLLEHLAVIIEANTKLEAFHQQRSQLLAPSA